MNPFYTIITVCYNSEKTIERTIKSVLNQTFDDYEYIIVDGASTDGTLDIVKQYEPSFNGKLKYISEKDGGIYDAMNKGIKMASGVMVGIVNSDDYYESNALELIKNAYDGSEYTLIYGVLRQIQDGKEVGAYIKSFDNIEEDMIAHPSCFISRSIYEKYGLYSLDYRYSADYEFMLRIRNEKDIKVKEVDDVISNFSIDGASNSVKAYMDTLRLKHNYGLMNPVKYHLIMLKCKLAVMLGR